ncbi:PREDICTED: neurocan core protein-like, partial [Mesitornis unicolor]|uniref:neurocan core protein-like n=1 Tax=Mesitornis unicolor TaxID=54374 RepID=UPI0005287F1D
MVHVMEDAGCWLLLGLCLLPGAVLGSQDEGKVIHINRVQHQAVRVGLGEPVALPCLFLLQPSAALGPNEPPDPPRIKWSKVRSATGQREDVPILVAKDNAVKVVKAYEGRVALPGYPHNRSNATLVLHAARASDAGLYRCEVVAGIDDEQDLLPLEVTGVVFHYPCPVSCWPSAPHHRQPQSQIPTVPHLSIRYPITLSRPGCYGDRNSLPGIRSYGRREPEEEYDVYCYARELQGTVFYATVPGRFTWQGARRHCRSRGASLATTGQLYLAWRPMGLGADEDEQLRPVSSSPAAQRGDLPGMALSPSPHILGDATSLPPTATSSLAWPHKDEALNVVDQAPGSSRQDPVSTSPALTVQEAPGPLLPQAQSPAQEQHSTSSPPALPGTGMVPSAAAETPGNPRRSSYAGLNGRHFQLQWQSWDPPV